MRKEEIQIFVDGVVHYFATVSKIPPQVSNPYLIEELGSSLFEYSGLIGITGQYRGNVIFTAPEAMMSSLLHYYHGVRMHADAQLDLVGEIANTIAGNAREELGSEFEISPPIVSRGSVQQVRTAEGLQTYCIPLVWEEVKANVIVAMV